jgi:hypothetical protein
MDMVLGPNPYDPDNPGGHWLPINLIPPALTLLAPFALLEVGHAWLLWNAIVLLLWIVQTIMVIRLMEKPIWHPASLSFIVISILLDPLHIGLANGQPAVPAVSLVVISIWLARNDWQIASGIALAIATALKPQLAAPFVIYFLWQRSWKTVGSAAAAGILLSLLAIVPMQLHGIHWMHDWIGEVRYAELPGGINDARLDNTGRHDMIHLQTLLHVFSDNALLINSFATLVVFCLGCLLFIRARSERSGLAAVAAFSILALLFMYNRFYDAGILVLPIGWAVCNVTGPARWPARILLLIVPAFFIDQEWLDALFVRSDSYPQIQSAWWFNTLAEPHHVWELLAIFACICVALAAANPSDGSPPAIANPLARDSSVA